MNGRSRFLLIIVFFCFMFSSCSAKESANIQELSSHDQRADIDEITEAKYQKDGIEASYPVFIYGADEEKLKKWNQIILQDFQKILQIYAFNPFPELTPNPTNIPKILTIDYDIKLNNDQFISILYRASFNSPYSAHPTELVYTTNIDKTRDKRIRLSDIIKINSDFVKAFRTWDFIAAEEGNKEYNQAIADYIANLSDEDLMMGFLNADQIGSENLWGVFSYLTSERLGISIAVPNYIGDHVEFERDISGLTDYLNPEFKWNNP